MVGAFSVQIVFLPVAAARFGITHALGLGSVRSAGCFGGPVLKNVARGPVIARDVVGVNYV